MAFPCLSNSGLRGPRLLGGGFGEFSQVRAKNSACQALAACVTQTTLIMRNMIYRKSPPTSK